MYILKIGCKFGCRLICFTPMNIKRNIVFALEKRKKDGVPVVENVPIRMRVIYHHKRIEFTTGYRIDISKWDEDKQRVKNGCTNKLKQTAAEINSDLLKYYSDIQDIFKECEVNDIIPTPEQLKITFNNRQNKELPNNLMLETRIVSFMDKFDEFVRECGVHNNWTEATYEKFAATKNHLTNFEKDLSFNAEIPDIITDCLFETGAKVIAVIPENSLDDFIHGDPDKISLESIFGTENNLPNLGYLGAGMKDTIVNKQSSQRATLEQYRGNVSSNNKQKNSLSLSIEDFGIDSGIINKNTLTFADINFSDNSRI